MKRDSTPKEYVDSYFWDEAKKVRELVFMASLFLIGTGFMFYLFVLHPSAIAASNSDEGVVDNGYYRNPDGYRKGTPVLNRMSKDWVKYSGTFAGLETYDSIVFRLQKFNDTAKYIFDFGDGVQQVCNNGVAKHHYTKPGAYKVTVKVVYHGNETEAWADILHVKQNLIIDDAAL